MPEDIRFILDVSEGVKIDHSRLSSSLIILYRDIESMAYVDLDTFLVQVDNLVHGSAAPWGVVSAIQIRYWLQSTNILFRSKAASVFWSRH